MNHSPDAPDNRSRAQRAEAQLLDRPYCAVRTECSMECPRKIWGQFPSRVSVTRLNSCRGERVEIKPKGLDQEMLSATRAPRNAGSRRCVDLSVSSVAFQPGKFSRFARSFPLPNGLPGAIGAPEIPFRFVRDFLECNMGFTNTSYNFRFTLPRRIYPKVTRLEICELGDRPYYRQGWFPQIESEPS
jgi:hypothetical protein